MSDQRDDSATKILKASILLAGDIFSHEAWVTPAKFIHVSLQSIDVQTESFHRIGSSELIPNLSSFASVISSVTLCYRGPSEEHMNALLTYRTVRLDQFSLSLLIHSGLLGPCTPLPVF